MDLGLQSRIAVIVGGASGIGWATATEFAREGSTVVVIDRVPDVETRVEALPTTGAAQAKHLGLVADVCDEGQIRSAFAQITERIGGFDHVVIAAGVGSGKFGFPFTNLQPNDWGRVLDVNLMGTVNVAHACVDVLRQRRYGSITLISSVAGQIGSQTDPPYSAAKAAVINFGQCMAKDLAPFNVRVNTICPGMIRTDLNRSVWQAWHDAQPPEARLDYETWAGAKIRAIVPLGRWQEPRDIAAMIAFLASQRAENITGQTINVDGGFVMHW